MDAGLTIPLATLVLLVALALAFDFMNGFHDAANSIATVVSTGVLKPHTAVAFAAFFNVVAIFVFQLKVASTVGKGIVDPAIVDHYVIFGALIGAIVTERQTALHRDPVADTPHHKHVPVRLHAAPAGAQINSVAASTHS